MAQGSTSNSTKILSTNQTIQALGGKQKLSQASTIYSADEITSNVQSGSTMTQYENTVSYIVHEFQADGSISSLSIPNVVAGDGYIIYARNYGVTGGESYDLTNVHIWTDSGDLSNMYGDVTYTSATLNAGDAFTINMSDSQATTLYISATATGSPLVSWEIYREITPYSYSEIGSAATSVILAKMGELDTNNEYKIPNKTFPIDNPLAAASFLNSEHMYNKFTICQMDLDNLQIK